MATKSDKNEKGAPMDATAPEVTTGVAAPNNHRNAYALDTLIAEVADLFPEVTYEVSGFDGRNTALDVQFVDEDDAGLEHLIPIIKDDERVSEVLHDADERTLLVSLWGNARIQDSRDPFNLADAWLVLFEDEGSL